MLITTNYDLQQAVNLHFERVRGLSGSNDVSPEDEVAGKLLHNMNTYRIVIVMKCKTKLTLILCSLLK